MQAAVRSLQSFSRRPQPFFKRVRSSSDLAATVVPKSSIRSLLHGDQPSSETPVRVDGWLRVIRRQKSVVFAVLNDGSSATSLQAVLSPPELADGLSVGCAARFQGTLKASLGKEQSVELVVSEVKVIGACDLPLYPMQKKHQHTAGLLRRHAHLRPRLEATAAMLRLRSELTNAAHAFFRSRGLLNVQTPIVTSSNCEGAGEVFLVAPASAPASPNDLPFWSGPAYLTVSAQLHLEALSASLGSVYTLSPVFRAEESSTSRHLAEFWMLEAELAFCHDLSDIMETAEGCVRACVEHVVAMCVDDLNTFEGAYERLRTFVAAPSEPWMRMTYADAVQLLKRRHAKQPFVHAPEHGAALQTEHERWLADDHALGAIFITNYPGALKPFYMRANKDAETVACFDLLMPTIGELAGGSLREERLDTLVATMDARGMGGSDNERYRWYIDLRRFGSVPHGGFGLGWERLVAFVTGIDNVRDCVAFPRAVGTLHF